MTMPEWLQKLWDGFLDVIQAAVSTIGDMLKDIAIWLVDQLMDVAIAAMNGLASFLDWNPAEYISALPESVINMMGLIGVGQALSIVTGALIIRMLLQLIPFVRLGS